MRLTNYVNQLFNAFLEFNENLVVIRNFVGKTYEEHFKKVRSFESKHAFIKELKNGIDDIFRKVIKNDISNKDVEKELDELVANLEKQHNTSFKKCVSSINKNIVKESIIGVPIDSIGKRINFYKKSLDFTFKNGLENIVTAFEEFISEIIQLRFNMYPDTLKDKSIKYGDLETINKVSDIKKLVAKNEAEIVLKKNPSDYMTLLSKYFSIELVYYKENRSNFLEIFYRRNIFVHNKGVVNKTYINSSGNPYKLQKNTVAFVNADYLHSACSLLLLCAADIIISIISKLNIQRSKYNENENEIQQIAFKCYLNMERWDFAKEFYKILCRNEHLKRDTRDMYKLNILLCEKKLGEISKTDIQKQGWKNTRPFLLQGYYALTEEYTKMANLIINNCSSGANLITVDNLKAWPIYSSFRQKTSLYNDLLAKITDRN